MREVTLAEKTAWQRQAVTLLGKLLALAAKRNLPPIAWTVQTVGPSLVGSAVNHAGARRRADYEAWKAAITVAAGVPDQDSKRDFPGETCLTAAWERVPVTLVRNDGTHLRVRVALVASIWGDEEESTNG
jgi:hypothetical protein